MFLEGVYAGEVRFVLISVPVRAAQLPRVAPPFDWRARELVAAVLKPLPVAGAALLEGVGAGPQHRVPGRRINAADFREGDALLVHILRPELPGRLKGLGIVLKEWRRGGGSRGRFGLLWLEVKVTEGLAFLRDLRKALLPEEIKGVLGGGDVPGLLDQHQGDKTQ